MDDMSMMMEKARKMRQGDEKHDESDMENNAEKKEVTDFQKLRGLAQQILDILDGEMKMHEQE